ncbi:kyphoscoliosis peptidase [Strongylocentrotus purpuratus]|uniref:Transglutaminase-like domain-containing protein n=1 Tax=Strongylocentrotus purpuratus TaxID=7668 RepID=A0A7M7GH35_STRPU|nr:kyphoscoliosis peptidase [Strongylocentrotus purpuratus]
MGCGGSKSTAVVESNVDVRRHNGIKRSNDVINERATVDESRGYTEQNSGNVTEGQSVKVNEEIAHPLKHKNVINGHTTGIDDGVVINQQRDEPDSIERKSKQNVRQSAPYKIPTDPKTVSPFDPSVNVAKYREEPIPVFGRAAFPLSKDTPDLKIEDTFWPGKRALIPDYNQMKKLDKHAIETPPGLRKDMDQLVAHLTTVANSELEKLRVIFRWVAHNTEYNVEGFRTGMYGDNSAEAVLRTGLAVCGGYSNLMVAMCAKAGVECVKITGYAKGSGYWPGKENLSKMTHAWNRVTLNGSTFLCDCTWAAGSVDTAFTRHWKEGQFLAEPKSFANHHFPKGVDIQKIFSTQSLEDWNNTPVLGALAQFSGLECVSHKEGIIKAPSNSCLIKLKLERALYNTFCIVKNEDGTKLKGVALQWWNKNELSCSIRLPKAGRYSFVLIGKISWQRNDNGNTEVLYPEQPSDAIRNTIVSYVIKATGGEKLDPMSTEEINLYGAPLNLPDYGLTPADKNEATVQAVAGSAHVVFKKLHEGPSSVRVDVCKVGDQNKKMESSVYCEHFDDWVVCHVRCPSAGKYTLTMYVKSDHEDYSCRLTYIIVCTGKFDPIRLPDMSRVSGPNAKFAGLGLRLRDTLTSTIVTVEGEGQLVITCDTTKEMKIIAGLKDISESPNNDGDYVVETNKTETEQVTTVSLRLKTKGFFKLTLFAKPKTESVPTPKKRVCRSMASMLSQT